MQSAPEELKALTSDEIELLRIRITELDPEGDDIDTADLLDTLAILPNGGEDLEKETTTLEDSYIYFDLYYGDVNITDDTYSGYIATGTAGEKNRGYRLS